MFGDLAPASDNMTWINIELGERGSLFLLEQVKCVNNFFKFFTILSDLKIFLIADSPFNIMLYQTGTGQL